MQQSSNELEVNSPPKVKVQFKVFLGISIVLVAILAIFLSSRFGTQGDQKISAVETSANSTGDYFYYKQMIERLPDEFQLISDAIAANDFELAQGLCGELASDYRIGKTFVRLETGNFDEFWFALMATGEEFASSCASGDWERANESIDAYKGNFDGVLQEAPW